MAKTTTAYIGLGSNLGDRKAYIDKALKLLARVEGVEVTAVSNIIETAPLGDTTCPKYLNAIGQIQTILDAQDLHRKMLDIETSLGRTRNQKWSPRTIDLDLVLFGAEVINTPKLKVPHPQMHLRSFVLKGLCQLDAHLQHPILKVSVEELARRLNEADFAVDPDGARLVSVAGIIGVGKTTLVNKISEFLDCKLLFEPYDTNPFMPQVYAGKKELALDSQLYFLANRVDQLNVASLGTGTICLSDYIFDKELIYARRLLNRLQLDLYTQIHERLRPMVSPPALVIYLRDSAENCLKRIRQRNRPYEQKIKLTFLKRLAEDYDVLFAAWKRSPVIRLSKPEFDCTCRSDVENLSDQIRAYIQA